MTERSDEFSIGRVIAQGLAAVARRPVATCIPALLFGALPAMLIGYATEDRWDRPDITIGLILASLWSGVVTNILSQGALARAVLDGDGTEADNASYVILRLLAPLLAAGALIGAASVGASMIAVLPGLLPYALWSVTGPVIAEEGRGAVAGMRRSAALVRPFFWRIVLLNLLLIMGHLALSAVLAAGGLYLWYGPEAFTDGGAAPDPLGFYILYAPFLTLATAAWGAVIVALYADLRERLDGVPADRLARIFA